ncbi:MAG: porin [Paracoccaceae bacterium]|nr:MAG: porin [Paracoccaceae bacterium]
MKKVLLATTALMLSAGVAAADFKIGGTARAGIVYNSDPGTGATKTRVNMRLRFNIDASKELDSGVTLGGRIRMQYDQSRINDSDDIFGNRSGAALNAAYLYATAGGLRVEVGNVNTAFDSAALLYAAELGYVGTTQGGYNLSSYTAYVTGPYTYGTQINRMGLFASYSVGDLVARISYVNPNQNVTDLPVGVAEEISISANYKAGAFTVSAAFAANGNFIDGNDIGFIGAEYEIQPGTAIGLQLFDHGKTGAGADKGSSVSLYGRTKLANGLGLGAFVSSANSKTGVAEKTAYGIGFDYDLGGATLAGTIQKSHSDTTYADLGIRFSF